MISATMNKTSAWLKIDTDGSEPLAISGMTQLIKKSPGIRVITEFEPPNVRRYLSNH